MKKITILGLIACSYTSCFQKNNNCLEVEQRLTQKIDSLEEELANYKILHEIAKEMIESDSSSLLKEK